MFWGPWIATRVLPNPWIPPERIYIYILSGYPSYPPLIYIIYTGKHTRIFLDSRLDDGRTKLPTHTAADYLAVLALEGGERRACRLPPPQQPEEMQNGRLLEKFIRYRHE